MSNQNPFGPIAPPSPSYFQDLGSGSKRQHRHNSSAHQHQDPRSGLYRSTDFEPLHPSTSSPLWYPTAAHLPPGTSMFLQPVRHPQSPPVDPLPLNFGRFRTKFGSPSSNSNTLLSSSSRVRLAPSHNTLGKVFQPTTMLRSFVAGRSQVRNRNTNGGYQGDTTSNMYRSQIVGLPDHLNTALWISGIPVLVTPSEIFDNITCGAVSALNLKGPDLNHDSGAADLIFKTPEGAAHFLAEINEGIFMHGRRLKGIYNIRGEQRNSTNQSRVIRIEGPEQIMKYEFWQNYFSQVCIFYVERAFVVSEIQGRKTLEFRFVRITAQSQACLNAICCDPVLRQIVRVWYAADPCEGVAPQ